MYKLEGQIRFSECDTSKRITLPGNHQLFFKIAAAHSLSRSDMGLTI